MAGLFIWAVGAMVGTLILGGAALVDAPPLRGLAKALAWCWLWPIALAGLVLWGLVLIAREAATACK